MTPAATIFVYGALACIATRFGAWLCRDIVPFDDGPSPGTPNSLFVVAAASAVGAALALRHASLMQTAVTAVLTAALAACYYCDVTCGIVPDECTLAPLGAVLTMSLFARDVTPVVACSIVFVLFALFALISKGRGLGWGDVKLAALVASVLGLQVAMAAFIGASFLAAASALIRRRRREPIAFAPYLAGSTAVALMLPPSLR